MVRQDHNAAEKMNTLGHEAKIFAIRLSAVAEILSHEAHRCNLPHVYLASVTELASAAHDLNEVWENSISAVRQEAGTLSESEMNPLFDQLRMQAMKACETAQRSEVIFRRMNTKQYEECLQADFTRSIEQLQSFTNEFHDWLSTYSTTNLQ